MAAILKWWSFLNGGHFEMAAILKIPRPECTS
jgi:hypothetical protein